MENIVIQMPVPSRVTERDSTKIVSLNASLRSKKECEERERDIANPLGQLAVYRCLTRVWRSSLSSPEISVLLYLLDQTVGIGIETRTFTVRGMNRGADKAAGLGMGATQLRQHLHNLENKGLIGVNSDKSTGFTITVNRDWEPETTQEEGGEMLSKPNRMQQELSERVGDDEKGWEDPIGKPIDPCRKTDTPPVGKPAPPLSENRHPLKEPTLSTFSKNLSKSTCGSSDDDRDGWEGSAEENSIPEETTSVPLGSVRKRQRPSAKTAEQDVPAENFATGFTDPLYGDVPAPARKRARPTAEELAAHREAKRAEGRTRTNPGSVAKTFEEACREFFSDIEGIRHHTLTRVELGKLKQGLCKDWAGEAEMLHQFIEHAVANWTQIVAEEFKWMTQSSPPTAPDLLFLNWRRADFIDAWNQRKRSSWLDKVPTVDRRRYHTLTKVHGMSSQEAILKVAKEKSDRETREEVDGKLAEAKHHHRTAHLLEERSRRVAAPTAPGKSHNDKEIARLKAENERLRDRLSRSQDETLQPGSKNEYPEWDDSK
jgi:hypothetical protein